MTKTISHMLAMDRNRVIGHNNQLPWHLPADLAYFRKHTINKPVLMGRKTYASIGKALPKRENIVLTKDLHFQPADCRVVHSIDAAITYFQESHEEELMIIGGTEVFRQTLAIVNKLYVTEIDHEFVGDTYYPEISLAEWMVERRERGLVDDKNKYPHEFLIYKKIGR